MSDRVFFECGDGDKDLQFVAIIGKEKATVSVNDEWCGSSETGFGATVSYEITKEDAKKLIDTLKQWLDA